MEELAAAAEKNDGSETSADGAVAVKNGSLETSATEKNNGSETSADGALTVEGIGTATVKEGISEVVAVAEHTLLDGFDRPAVAEYKEGI